MSSDAYSSMLGKKSNPGRPSKAKSAKPQVFLGVTQKPSAENIIIEYRSHEPMCFKSLFNSFKGGSLLFICSPDEFKIHSKNDNLESTTYVEVDVKRSIRYYCNKSYIFKFDCDEVRAIMLMANSTSTYSGFSINEAREATFAIFDESITLMEKKQIRPTIIYEEDVEDIRDQNICDQCNIVRGTVNEIRTSYDLRFNSSTKALKKLFENFYKEFNIATIEKLPGEHLNFNTSMKHDGPMFTSEFSNSELIGLQSSGGVEALAGLTLSENIYVGNVKDCIKPFSDYTMTFYVMKSRGILLEFNVSNEDDKGTIVGDKSSVTAAILLKFYRPQYT
jgi:hypothetical protein